MKIVRLKQLHEKKSRWVREAGCGSDALATHLGHTDNLVALRAELDIILSI